MPFSQRSAGPRNAPGWVGADASAVPEQNSGTRSRNLWAMLKRAGAALILGAGVGACAAAGSSWKEEVLLHDGQRLIVERTVERGGRREVGQHPPIRQQSLTFTIPGSQKKVAWTDPFAPDHGTASFLPMLLEAREGVAYLVAHPMGCLSYNKWGRPNPPYVVFKYQEMEWSRIALQELPLEFRSPNLIFSSPDDEAKKFGKNIVSAEEIRGLYATYRQPEYRSILREEIPNPGGERCIPMVSNGKGLWRAQAWFDGKPTLEACRDGCRNEGFDEKTCPCAKIFEGK